MFTILIKSMLSPPSVRDSYGWYVLAFVNVIIWEHDTVGKGGSLENSFDHHSQIPVVPCDAFVTLKSRQINTKITLVTLIN